MTWYQFLCLIGAPSLFSGAVLFIVRSFISHERKHNEETKNKLAETEQNIIIITKKDMLRFMRGIILKIVGHNIIV